MKISSSAKFKSAEISAVKIRADGTVVDLGVISTWHRNPIIRWWRQLRLALRRA